ncbi:Molybdate-anion transporter [Durusdinium trenchii]|uniref:Molybdate-anion transporter n=1 Tax=Durusdinium trenchii TaxID=1381693 RepID=A0ABP0KEL8_9DINO
MQTCNNSAIVVMLCRSAAALSSRAARSTWPQRSCPWRRSVLRTKAEMATTTVSRRMARKTWSAVTQVRALGTSSGEKEEAAGTGVSYRVAERVNRSLQDYPASALGCILGMEILTIYGTHRMLVTTGVVVPAEFAVAFAMSRPFRRLRLPVELLGAAALCRVFPALRRVKLTGVVEKATPASVKQAVSQNSKLQAGTAKLAEVVDKYGAAYFISARWTGVGVVLGLYTATCLGLDVSGLLARWGVEEFGSVLGTWAASVVLSASLYPVSIFVGSSLAPLVGRTIAPLAATLLNLASRRDSRRRDAFRVALGFLASLTPASPSLSLLVTTGDGMVDARAEGCAMQQQRHEAAQGLVRPPPNAVQSGGLRAA